MPASPDRIAALAIRRLRRNHLLALLALLALMVSGGSWYWSTLTKASHLNLGGGVELKYRADLAGILCEEAAANDLKIDIQRNGRSKDAIERVNRGELDAAVIPAGLAVPGDNVRQVAMLECEMLHLFVRPDLLPQGVAGLRGKRLALGPPDNGVRILAEEVLKFIGMRPGVDYQDEAYAFTELRDLPPQAMPDGIFSLSPLPSPMGQRLVREYGYQLMDLPFGEALALRKPYLDDVSVPAHTYGAYPAVPGKLLHTVGTRAVLIAHCDVPKTAIRRLLEVLYESNFARRVGMSPLDVKLLERPGEYPNHAGTVAYLHRHDPWINSDIVENLKRLRGMIVSAISAAILAWQWYRRRNADGLDDYLRAGNELELSALRAASRREFGEAELQASLGQLTSLRIAVLEAQQEGLIPADQQLAGLLSRLDGLQQSLPRLVGSGEGGPPFSLALPSSRRQAS